MKIRTAGALVLGLALVVSGCRPDDQRTDSVDMEQIRQDRESFPQEGLDELDSGNEAYSAGDHEEALEHYRRATEMMPENAASWFGIVMAAGELDQTALADSALARARELAPGASLIHPDDPSGGGS